MATRSLRRPQRRRVGITNPCTGSEAAHLRHVARQVVALALHAGEQLGNVDAGLLPALEQRHEEPLLIAVVDHGPGRLEREVLELLALGRAQLGHAALDVLHAVRVVARLVARDVGEELLQQRLFGEDAHLAEAVEREPLDDDLHADELLQPVAGLERGVENRLERRGDRPQAVELLDVAREHLDVPRLVHGLRRGVELGVGVRQPR